MFKTLTLSLVLLLTSCVEVGIDGSEPQDSGNPLPPITGGQGNDNDTSDDDTTPDDEGDDDTVGDDDDDVADDDTTPVADDDTVGDDDTTPAGDDDTSDDDDSTPIGDDDDDTTPAPTPTGDVSWWYYTEGEVIYDEVVAFAWSWAWQQAGDPSCSDCYVLLNVMTDTNYISGSIAQQPDLNDLPEGTVVSFDIVMQNNGEPELWSCQNGSPSGTLQVQWNNQVQTVCTIPNGVGGCTRAVQMGSGNCAAF